MAKVVGSIPTCGILAQMCEFVNALRVMHLPIHSPRNSPSSGIEHVPIPHTARTLNQLENQSARTAEIYPDPPRIADRLSGINGARFSET